MGRAKGNKAGVAAERRGIQGESARVRSGPVFDADDAEVVTRFVGLLRNVGLNLAVLERRRMWARNAFGLDDAGCAVLVALDRRGPSTRKGLVEKSLAQSVVYATVSQLMKAGFVAKTFPSPDGDVFRLTKKGSNVVGRLFPGGTETWELLLRLRRELYGDGSIPRHGVLAGRLAAVLLTSPGYSYAELAERLGLYTRDGTLDVSSLYKAAGLLRDKGFLYEESVRMQNGVLKIPRLTADGTSAVGSAFWPAVQRPVPTPDLRAGANISAIS